MLLSLLQFTIVVYDNSSGVLNGMINNTFSEVNVFDFHVQADLANLIETLQGNDTDIRTVVFSSGNQDFFIAHYDIDSLSLAACSGGNEFIMSCDMRFATTAPSMLVSQSEISIGVPPGAGGAMYLAHKIGHGRAFEYVLYCLGRTDLILVSDTKAHLQQVLNIVTLLCSTGRLVVRP
ncbi:ClpP/crotonase-like domain-containing protein [Mycena galopus ATCC 62051]|nr:ClpP/crotonase-like domain-containing protein [Mycena galopus ATCC 62051]